MIENLENLKRRTQVLQFSDRKELDDIKRKSKMYLEQLFPTKFLYPNEVDAVNFNPRYIVGGTSQSEYREAWVRGQQELINLLDTRIEEYKIYLQKLHQFQNTQKTSPTEKIIEVEKIVEVENTSKIKYLESEIDTLKKEKRLWRRIDWGKLITIFLTIIAGSFFLGKYLGENRFDNEKIQLSDSSAKKSLEIKSLQQEIQHLKNSKKDSIK